MDTTLIKTPISTIFDVRTLFLVTLVFIVVVYLVWVWESANLPPGPQGWPLVGYLPNLGLKIYRTGLEPHRVFAQLAAKYGKVYSLYMGRKLVVMINSADVAREAFKSPHLNGRPPMNTYPDSYLGILLSSGRLWQFQRRFTLHQFREHGIGRSRFQDKIIEETSYLLQVFRLNEGAPTDYAKYISNAVSNILCSVVFGKRFHYSDEDFRHIINLLDRSVESAGTGAINLFIPFLAYFQPRYLIRQTGAQLKSFIFRIVDEHKEKYDDKKLADYIDVFLSEIEHDKNNNVKEQVLATDQTLYQTVIQLFAAGSETTANALRWALLYMTVYPEMQSRAQKEIDSFVGRYRLPRIDDKLPFTESVIMEVQRHATILPLGVPHVATADTKLQGRNIPKGAILFCNIWAIHHDPDVWLNPEEFNPERFLDADGNVQRQPVPYGYVPFSTGHRKCLGEHLAKMELFIMFSHLLHQFSFKPPPGVQLSVDGTLGAGNAPKPYQVIATKRD